MKHEKLACTASGMGFEAWRQRPVYRVQCVTFRIAQMLCGVALQPGKGRASCFDDPRSAGLDYFRCLSAYRTPQANALRKQVAHYLKLWRRKAGLRSDRISHD